jgi:succinate-acetate transporter protein
VTASSDDPLVADAARILLRPIANPLPLGFLALAAGTLVVSALQLGWIAPDEARDVGLILVLFVAPLQLIASVFGFLARDIVAGTGMGILAGTWLSVGAVTVDAGAARPRGALGILLALAAVAMLVPALVAAQGKVVPALVLITTSIRFATTAVYELTSDSHWKTVSGTVGVVLAVLAIYAALAMALEDAARRTVLPLLRRGTGARSMSGNLREQLEHMERHAGVREQL